MEDIVFYDSAKERDVKHCTLIVERKNKVIHIECHICTFDELDEFMDYLCYEYPNSTVKVRIEEIIME